jgi:hypothetical protein
MGRAVACAGLTVCVAMAFVVTLGAQAPPPPQRQRGNPTPGTAQPEMPKLADRIALTGCLTRVEGAPAVFDGNTPSDTRYLLSSAKRLSRLPPGAGTSPVAAASTVERYRLSGIEGAISPFADARVEVSGQVETPSPEAARLTPELPVLRVEFVKKIAASCR